MLIDQRGIVIASCPILPTGVPLSDAQLIPLVTPASAGLGQCAERRPRRTIDFDYRIRPGAGNQPSHQ